MSSALTPTQRLAAARSLAAEVLRGLAPEVDIDTVDASGSLQEQFDLDSIGFLEMVTAIHDRIGVDILESDYPQLASLDGCVRYIAARWSG